MSGGMKATKTRVKQTVYFVSGVNREPLRHRVWGFFYEKARAFEAARTNETDINEAGYYPLALVTEACPGLAQLPERAWWFRFRNGKYRQIPTPNWTKRFGWM